MSCKVYHNSNLQDLRLHDFQYMNVWFLVNLFDAPMFVDIFWNVYGCFACPEGQIRECLIEKLQSLQTVLLSLLLHSVLEIVIS